MTTTPYFLDPVWQMMAVREANGNEHIDILHLTCLLGISDIYDRQLPNYWESFQLNKRLGPIPDLDTPEKRIGVWFQLLTRMSHGSVAGIWKGLKPIRRLKVYEHNEDTGKYEETKPPMDTGGHIRLSDLKQYFEVYQIPLPPVLFPSAIGKKMLPSQEDRKGAVAIAEKYIALCVGNGVTPRIYEAVEIIKRELTRNMYKDKTIHDWIKDCFPPDSRKPGRPQKTG